MEKAIVITTIDNIISIILLNITQVIHKMYQFYRPRNCLDVRASQSALSIT